MAEHTAKAFLDDILSACDASNWDANLNQGDYFRGLRDAYERVRQIACDYQMATYAATKDSREDTSIKAAFRCLIEAGDKLSFSAQTTGGVAGRDGGLVSAIDDWTSAKEQARQLRRIARFEPDDPGTTAVTSQESKS